MSSRFGSVRSVASLLAVMSLACMWTFALSSVVVKLCFLTLFLLAALVSGGFGRRVVVYPRLVVFYVSMCVVGIVWAIVGLLNPGNYVSGVFDALRLYVIWSVAVLLLYSLFRSESSLRLIHVSMVLSALLISTINLAALADQIRGWGLIPEAFRQDLQLRIGFHEGYIQITSFNIGSLFIIVPYLVSLQFRTDATRVNTWRTKLALAMCLLLTALSGRRALWLVVALTPCLILVLSIVTRSHGTIRPGAVRLLRTYTVALAAVVGLVVVRPEGIPELGYVSHLRQAFSAEDERTIQKPYLIGAFLESPIIGSGFGAYAGYSRSELRPWTYELTYHQVLFNLGLVGLIALGGLVSLYLGLVIRLLTKFTHGSAIPFALVIGSCALLIGVYSNPYFGSFDFLFFLGLLPYLSTFRQGFEPPAVRTES